MSFRSRHRGSYCFVLANALPLREIHYQSWHRYMFDRYIEKLQYLLLMIFFFIAWGMPCIAHAEWTNEETAQLQTVLKENGFYNGPSNGIMDEETRLAIEEAAEDFPIPPVFDNKRKDYFYKIITSMYNAKYEYRRIKENDGQLATTSDKVPHGIYRFSKKHEEFWGIIHTTEWSFFQEKENEEFLFQKENKCELKTIFENLSFGAREESIVHGRCELVKWRSSGRLAMLFWARGKTGENMSTESINKILVAGGKLNMPKMYEFDSHGENIALDGVVYELVR
jgi:hypothetical protein